MASASVGSPMMSCHCLTGSCEVTSTAGAVQLEEFDRGDD